MLLDEVVTELLLRWEEKPALTPEELCCEHKDHLEYAALLKAVSRGIRDLQAANSFLDTSQAEESGSPRTLSHSDGSAAPGLRYRLVSFHAKGGLGEVFRAEDEELHREVALKRIQECHRKNAESQRRFLREAEITAKLQHPGIVPVYGLASDGDGQPCYAMRFIEGGTLGDALKRFHEADGKAGRDLEKHNLAQREMLTRFIAVCNTVAYAHSRGIVHRDLKPGNIMLGDYGETLVVDWGLAKPFTRTEVERSTGEESLMPTADGPTEGATQLGQALGTPAYMSPEQAEGRWDVVGPASDIFSLGATLYAVLTGQAPYRSSSNGEALSKARRGDFPSPRQVNKDVPRALEAICQKAMALELEQRYLTAKELAADVEQWLADQPVTAYREPWIVKARRWLGRHRTLATATLTTLLVATASLIVATILLKTAYDRESNAKVDAEEQRDRAEANLRLVLLGLQGVSQLGESYDQKDLSKEAEAAYSLAITLSERITQAYPDNPEYQSLLAQSYLNLGDRYGATSQIKKAETFDRKALAVWEPLVRAHPEVSAYTVGLGRTYGTMGHLLLYRKNQPQEALTWHDRAIPLLEKVLEATPRDALARQVLSRVYTSRAYALNKLHRYREAVADWERAIKLEDDPTRRARWRIHLAWTLRQVHDYARAVEEAKAASRSANLSDSELVDLASTFGVAASAARRMDSEAQAQEYIQHALRLLERAADKGYFKNPANIRELKTDTDFEALQSRPDFPQLLKRLEAPPPRK